jgi:hypothetical protein
MHAIRKLVSSFYKIEDATLIVVYMRITETDKKDPEGFIATCAVDVRFGYVDARYCSRVVDLAYTCDYTRYTINSLWM